MGNDIIKRLVREELKAKKQKLLQEKIKKILIPIIAEEVRTFRTPTRYIEEFSKALKSACGDWTNVTTNVNQDRIIFDDGESGQNFSVELDIVGLNNFTITYRLGNVKSRGKVYNLSADDVKDFITDHLKGRKDERDKQPEIDKKKKEASEVEDEFKEESKEVKTIETQLDKADEVDKLAKKSASEEKPKGEDDDRGMVDATKFKKQEDAKDTAEIAKGGKVSRAKEMPTDKEKEIKKVSKNNFAQ